MLGRISILKRLQKNLEDLPLKQMYRLCQRHKLLGGDLSQATLGWKIRQRVLVYQDWLSDLMFALISTEELEDLNQICVKQLKNRYNDPTMNKRFILGIDRAKMRLYDVEQEPQKDLVDSGQEDAVVFDNTPFAGKTSKYEKNFRTSRFRKTYKVQYYHDVNIDTKKWEVIELPTNNVIKTFDFEEDAEEVSNSLNKNKPFGDYGFSKIPIHK